MDDVSKYGAPSITAVGRAWPRGIGLTIAHGRLDWALALLVGAASLAVQVFALRNASLWNDETYSVGLVNQPFGLQLRYIWSKEVNMTLYYLVLRGWLGLTGLFGLPQSELIVRLPTILFAALGVVVLYALGRRFWGRLAGGVAATLYLLNYLQLMMAGQTRAYGLALLLVIAASFALLCAVTTDDRMGRLIAVYVVTMTLATYAHVVSGLVLVAHVSAIMGLSALPGPWQSMMRRRLRGLLTGFALVFLLIAPLGLDIVLHGSGNAWLPPATPTSLVRFGWHVVGHNPVYAALVAILGLLGVVAAVRAPGDGGSRRSRWSRWLRPIPAVGADEPTTLAAPRPFVPTFVVACWLVVPLVLAYALSQRKLNLHLFGDYLVLVVPALCLLIAVGVTVLRERRTRIADRGGRGAPRRARGARLPGRCAATRLPLGRALDGHHVPIGRWPDQPLRFVRVGHGLLHALLSRPAPPVRGRSGRVFVSRLSPGGRSEDADQYRGPDRLRDAPPAHFPDRFQPRRGESESRAGRGCYHGVDEGLLSSRLRDQEFGLLRIGHGTIVCA